MKEHISYCLYLFCQCSTWNGTVKGEQSNLRSYFVSNRCRKNWILITETLLFPPLLHILCINQIICCIFLILPHKVTNWTAASGNFSVLSDSNKPSRRFVSARSSDIFSWMSRLFGVNNRRGEHCTKEETSASPE